MANRTDYRRVYLGIVEDATGNYYIPPVAARVLMIATPGKRMLHSPDPLRRKRRLFWRNDTRNRLIAEVARALVSGDHEALRKSGICTRRFPRRAVKDVVVLVESLEHARRLSRELPGWEILSLVPDDMKYDGEPPNDSETDCGKIVTLSYVYKHGIAAKALVRAAGDGGLFPVDHICDSQDNQRLPWLIIDFADQLDRLAEQDTEDRKWNYHLRRCRVFNPDGEEFMQR